MNNCPLGLTTAIGAAAAAISKNLTHDEIAFLAAVLVQLGDTLTTIAAQRTCKESDSDNDENPKNNDCDTVASDTYNT